MSVIEQEIPDGYKQTDVGVIPDDWEVNEVSKAFEICNTLRFPLSAKVRESMAGEYPYYGPTRIQDYINEYRIDGEYALIGEDGDHFLKFETVPQTQLAKGKFNVNNHAHVIKGKVATAEWFYLFFKHREITSHLSRQGAGRYKLNKATLEQLPCAIPPKQEQTAIANALSDVDALSTELEKLIAKKQAIKTATMQQLLTGKTRLPQFAFYSNESAEVATYTEGALEGKSQDQPKHSSGTNVNVGACDDGSQSGGMDSRRKGTKPSELGEIPEDWSVMAIGDISNVKTGPFGSALHEKDYVNDGTPIITVEHLGEKGITYQNLPMVSDADKSRLKAYQLFEGDIVFSRVGSIDRNALVTEDESGWLFSGRLLRVKLKIKNQNPSFFSHQFHTEPFKARVREVAVGQTMPSLNTEILKNILVVVPKYHEEQTAIATILSDMDNEIQTLEQRLAKTRQIKQGMMQELLTGRTRLLFDSTNGVNKEIENAN